MTTRKIKKTIVRCLLACTCVLLLGSVAALTTQAKTTKHKVKKAPQYFSITNTYDAGNETFITNVYEMNFKTKKMKLVGSVPYTSQYPLATYVKRENKIYYSACAKDGRGDELFVKDLKTGVSKQLTHKFFAINYIIDMGKQLFIGAVTRGDDDIIHPFFYSKKTKKLKDIQVTKDFFVSCANRNPLTNELYVAGYLNADDRWSFEHQTKDADMLGIKHFIYKFTGKKFKKLYTQGNCYYKSMTVSDKGLLFKWRRTYSAKKAHMSELSLNKKKNLCNDFSFPQSELNNMPHDGLIYADKKNIYYIRYSEKSDRDQFCQYDRKKKKVKVLYTAPKLSAINNAQIY
ncbi:MAG: hypothetical protein K6A23_10855 [Butyrivibrio sp.]|nr:hypothetical protein [Butyrivibrio sp.]